MIKKLVLGSMIILSTIQLFGCTSYTNIDEYKSVVKEESINEKIENKFSDKRSEYIEGEKPLYVDGMLLVNKDYGLPKDYEPTGGKLEEELIIAFREMKEAAKKDRLTINIRSGYRSYDVQTQLYNNYVRTDGQEDADRYSAIPGFSEHQTGLAIDITTSDTVTSIGFWFDDTPQAKWLYENAYKYGFVLRYPEGKEDITGYRTESWHYRYLGKEHSKYFNMNNLTLEEYFDIYDV